MEIPKIEAGSVKKSVDSPAKDEPVIKPAKEEESQKKPAQKTKTVQELFSNVWTKDIKKTQEQKPITQKRVLDEIQKKIQKSDANKAESISKMIESFDAPNKEDKNSKSSTATEVNEYLAKIQALVYEHFYPPKNSQGNSVTALIELSPLGKVIDFRILVYSDSDALNRECDKIKERLSNILFPINPNNSSGRYKITLIPKE